MEYCKYDISTIFPQYFYYSQRYCNNSATSPQYFMLQNRLYMYSILTFILMSHYISVCPLHAHAEKRIYLRRYERPWCLTGCGGRRGPSRPRALNVTRSGTPEDGRHAGRDRHPDRHRAHRVHHHAGVRERWHGMGRSRRSRARTPCLRMRRRRGRVRGRGPERTRRARRCINSSRPIARRRRGASRRPRRMLLRHFELLPTAFHFASRLGTAQHRCKKENRFGSNKWRCHTRRVSFAFEKSIKTRTRQLQRQKSDFGSDLSRL